MVKLIDATAKTLDDDLIPYDSKVVDYYISNPQFVEKAIIKYILNMEDRLWKWQGDFV